MSIYLNFYKKRSTWYEWPDKTWRSKGCDEVVVEFLEAIQRESESIIVTENAQLGEAAKIAI